MNTDQMKKTIFCAKHESLGARMVPFGGFYMPVEYSGIQDEHHHIRNHVGVFDIAHMGTFWVKGENSKALLQWVTSNDIDKLSTGKIQYTCFPNGKGGIVDDLLVYQYSEQKYMLVVNASNIEKDWKWLNDQNKFGAILENSCEAMAQLALQGPDAKKVLQKICDLNLDTIPYYTFAEGTVAGKNNIIVSATGYTGAGGFELYFYKQDALEIWNAIFAAGKEFNIKPAGLGARDTLRLEMGYPLYGNDIDDSTSPIEAGLGWVTKFSKEFIDRDFLLQQKNHGTEKMRVGFILEEMGIPRQHYIIVDKNLNPIGEVTSGTMSPVLKKGIGMGYIQSAEAKIGNEVYITIRNKNIKAKIVKMPFV